MAQRQGISTILLERFALGEVSEAERRSVEQYLHQDANLRHRLQEIEASNAAILEQYPARQMAAVIEARAAAGPRPSVRAAWWLPRLGYGLSGMAAVLLVLFLVLPQLRSTLPHSNGSGSSSSSAATRLKGGRAALFAYRKQGQRVERLAEGSMVHSGDRIQLSYLAGDDKYGVICSIDGNGAVTLHFPRPINRSTRFSGRKEVRLAHSYELDNAPGFERFFIVSSQRPLDVKKVLGAAQRLAATGGARDQNLELAGDLNQDSLLLKK